MASKKPAKIPVARFTKDQSDRYSAIQSLACEYFRDKDMDEWLPCVSRATREIDARLEGNIVHRV